MYQLTREDRYKVCVHEAAHAVIFALGGLFIERLEVAPEGCINFSTVSRRGLTTTDLWGHCTPIHMLNLFEFVHWNENSDCYIADKAGWKEMLKLKSRELVSIAKHAVRVLICGYLAGPIADEIQEGEALDHGPAWLEPTGQERHDLDKAYGLSQLSVWRNEYGALAALTEQTLRRPNVWAMVVKLACELERVGDMRNFDGFLPDAVAGWPSSTQAKKPVVIGALRVVAG